MNTIVTSREAILDGALSLAAAKGLNALNMRAVAAQCGVAVGSVYNYFPSKAELTAAVVGHVWQEIFHEAGPHEVQGGFCGEVAWFFAAARRGCARWPNFFSMHAVGFSADEKAAGRAEMDRAFAHMRAGLREALRADKAVRADAFTADFTEDAFVDFVFAGLLMQLSRGEDSCAVLLELIRRALY